MNNYSNFFERLHVICESKGLSGIQELANKLGYSSPEKLYRTGRQNEKGEFLKPSFDIIEDIANLFDDLNIRWLVTGIGEPFYYKNQELPFAAEPEDRFVTKKELELMLKKLKL